jgi:multiple sugar transport system permease protein
VRRRVGDNLVAYAFMAGALVCFAVFSWYPLVRGVMLAFQQTNFVDPPTWVGLANFRRVLADPLFVTAWKNTFLFTGLALLFGAVMPFFIAIVMNELRHLKGFFRLAVYLPVMLPPAVTALLWKYFYDPGNGLFNAVLRGLHLPTSQWVQSSSVTMLSLVFLATWANMGAAVIIYLAALGSIPGELYEAAEIDGASVFQRIKSVTLPQMRFVILVLVLLQIVATMQVFLEPYLLTGYSDNSSVTVMVLIYRYAFTVNHDFGLAAAMSVMLFLVLAAFSGLYMWVTRTRD